MRSDGMQFEFLGFDPEYEVKKFISSVAEQLQFSAPSDSSIKFACEQGARAFRASCRICSQAGEFVADAVGETPARAIGKIERKIKQQLEDWKQRRFREEV